MSNVVALADYRRPGSSEPWVKKPELAAHLKVSERWIEKRMSEGLPHWKLRRGAVRFKISDVESWLREERGA